ncbi:MAG: squalene--hopene cyclase [Planctomycetota bacterium]|nr:squalene--hopene cyclase [Planctomycetota bacterium]
MSSGWTGSSRFRYDDAHSGPPGPAAHRVAHWATPDSGLPRVTAAIERTRDWLLHRQAPEGYWVGELEGDTILESEYILLLAYLGRGQSEVARLAANYIVSQQLPAGGWALFPNGPLEISASVKAYWTLKITGHDPSAEYMVRAREAIRAAGGAEKVNSFTRFYFALLGIISYEQCAAVPPEIMLLPKWCPFNIYEMSAWSRTILVPLSLMWAFRPCRELPRDHHIDELFLTSPDRLPVTMANSEVVDPLKKKTWVDWGKLFRRIDVWIKRFEKLGIKPLRKIAVARGARWILDRLEESDGLGAIFPPIIWTVVVLKCLGHADDSPLVQSQLEELEKLSIREGDTVRLEPCRSPVWDTAIATIALREAGVPAESAALQQSLRWLLSKETRVLGDWAVRHGQTQPAGWYFEFRNQFYPDVDDTIMVMIALSRMLPENELKRWQTEFVVGSARGATTGSSPVSAVLGGHAESRQEVLADMQSIAPVIGAVSRGMRWVADMQNKDGGWGAFDRDNDREIYTRVPFADHNAMIDPSTADLTARVLEMFGGFGMTAKHPLAIRALEFVWNHQEPDHCWFGRWGVNYLYGTWQVLVGLTAIGVPAADPRVRRGVAWLKRVQQECGGWGETPATYDDPTLRGQGTPTASQTAWALLGLCAAGEIHSPAVDSGIQFLLDTQNEDGSWDEPEFTGTGFPRVFYLRYHLYRIYFPLMALGRIARLRQEANGCDETPADCDDDERRPEF